MNLVEGLSREIERNTKLLKEYEAIPSGAFGAILIRDDIRKGHEAAGSGDIVKMMEAYKRLENNK